MKRIIFIVSLIVLNKSYACENNNFKTDREPNIKPPGRLGGSGLVPVQVYV